MNRLVVGLLAIALCPSLTLATSPTFGADVAIGITQKMLAAPPLPTLEGSGLTISAQYGLVSAKPDKPVIITDNGVPKTLTYDGNADGTTDGVSLVSASASHWGYYFFALSSQIKGSTKVFENGVYDITIEDIDATSMAGAAGVTYRFLGTQKSRWAMGVFGGPAYVSIQSSSVYTDPNGANGGRTKFRFNPSVPGLYQGIQASGRFGNFTVTPYFLLFISGGNKCIPITADAGGSMAATDFACGNDLESGRGKMPVPMDFPAVGLFLGYRSFRLNIYSDAPGLSSDLTIRSLTGTLAYTF